LEGGRRELLLRHEAALAELKALGGSANGWLRFVNAPHQGRLSGTWPPGSSRANTTRSLWVDTARRGSTRFFFARSTSTPSGLSLDQRLLQEQRPSLLASVLSRWVPLSPPPPSPRRAPTADRSPSDVEAGSAGPFGAAGPASAPRCRSASLELRPPPGRPPTRSLSDGLPPYDVLIRESPEPPPRTASPAAAAASAASPAAAAAAAAAGGARSGAAAALDSLRASLGALLAPRPAAGDDEDAAAGGAAARSLRAGSQRGSEGGTALAVRLWRQATGTLPWSFSEPS